LSLGDLAIRYLLVGLVVILIRGVLTEAITAVMMGRRAAEKK
jgi:PTS system glucitol/sorbitol-specific IIC component